MTRWPKRWLAVLLAMLSAPLGMLYLGRPRLAIGYLVAILAIAVFGFLLVGTVYPISFTLLFAAGVAVHAYRLASAGQFGAERAWYSRWYGLISLAAVAILVMTLLRGFVLEPFHIPSASMFPTLPKGSRVLVKKSGYGNYHAYGIQLAKTSPTAALARGDLLVFEYPEDRSFNFVMRLVGLPGDRVEYRARQLSVNGELVSLPGSTPQEQFDIVSEVLDGQAYRVANKRDGRTREFEDVVKPSHLFFMGDNRDHANDSRYIGQVPIDHLVGKVVYIIVP